MTMALFAGRKLSIVLAVSLAMNALLVSAVAAHFYRGWSDAPRDRGGFGMERLADRLPPADGSRLRDVYRARAGELAGLAEDMRVLREKTRDLLREPALDRAALAEAMAAQRSRQEALGAALHGILFQAAAEMSAEGRERLADWPRRR